MSTTEEQVWRLLKPYVIFVSVCWGLTIMVMTTTKTVEDVGVQKRLAEQRASIQAQIDTLAAEDFDDYMPYRRIFPPKERVDYGSEIYMVSDSAVLKIGFVMTWREKVECDNNPYDDKHLFEFHAAGAVTSAIQSELRDFPEEGGKYLRGWPVREWRDPKKQYKFQAPILRYPEHDADCRVVSTMTQTHIDAAGNTHRKIITMKSEIAEVRGF